MLHPVPMAFDAERMHHSRDRVNHTLVWQANRKRRPAVSHHEPTPKENRHRQGAGTSCSRHSSSSRERHAIRGRPQYRVRVMNSSPGAAPLIAVVDDDESVRESLPDFLAQLGFLVSAFASAEEFLCSGSATSTHCLILDVGMPGMSGPDLQ